jgi:cell division protein FtsA
LSKTVLAVDIGSTKISVVIAEVTKDGDLEVTGHGFAKSHGVKKGIITNIELASRGVKKALADARRIAGNNISVATVSISNAYAKSLNSTGIVNIPHKDISLKEINRVMETALYNANIPNEYEVIHVLPYNFKVDDQDFIEDPYGMNASRMEVDVNIILTQKSSLSNLTKAIRSAGIDIESIVLNSYASAIATMNEDERELGVAVIDMGGQTSNLIIHTGNSIRYNDFIPVGSNHITNDLSMALHTPLQVAENVKMRYGDLMNESKEVIELPVIGDEENHNNISLEIVHSVVSARVEELLVLLERSFVKSALKEQVGSGMILTGGMTKLRGLRELAQAIFHGIPVRVGFPRALGGLFDELNDPAFATVIGLLLYRIGEHTQYEIDNARRLLHGKKEEGNPDDDLTNIRLREKETEAQEESNDLFGGKTIQTPKWDHKETRQDKDFSFDDLTDPDENEQGAMGRFGNWLKQLF